MNNQTKLSKQEKQSINYFKKTDTLKFIGAGVLIAGLLSLWIGRGWIGYILAIIGTPTGLVLFFMGSLGKANDSDMEADITMKMAGFVMDIESNKHYHVRLLENLKEITIEGYQYHDHVMIKKLKDASLRTSEFTRSKIRILKDSLYIISRDISLICDDVTDNTYEIFFDDMKTLEIERSNSRRVFNNTTYMIKPCYLHIVTDKLDLRLPIEDTMASDELITKINRQIKLYNEEKTANE